MRSQRLLKVHRLNPTPLQPALSNGVIIWTPSALSLHFLWAWQFLISLSIEGALVMLYTSAQLRSLKSPLLVLAIINTPHCAFPVLEICLYANLGLTSSRYLALQALKTIFYSTIFALRCIWFPSWCISLSKGVRERNEESERDAWFIVGRVAEVALLLLPYYLALVYGLVLAKRERTQRAVREPSLGPDRITVVLTRADEETRLLG